MKRLKLALAGAAALTAVAAGTFAYANHAWSTYHWSVSIYPLTLRAGDNVSTAWDAHLDKAISDWNASDVIALSKVTGATNPKNCKPLSGRIEVCSSAYGNNGWLGIAQIWLSGGHISQAVTKLNDSYFKTGSRYNTPEWRALVACQEIGHDFGLAHQDEDFSTDNTTSCMDYTSLPADNGQPDAHDYEELDIIYNHTHSAFTTITQGAASPARAPSEEAGGNSPAEWGRAVSSTADGTPDVFVKDLGGGRRLVTHVFWTEEARRKER